MTPTRCLVCDHQNPPRARFCSDCGSSLLLKTCLACDAVAKRSATRCWKCGTDFPVDTVQGGDDQPFVDPELDDDMRGFFKDGRPRVIADSLTDEADTDIGTASETATEPETVRDRFAEQVFEPPVLHVEDAIADPQIPEDEWVEGLPPVLLDEIRDTDAYYPPPRQEAPHPAPAPHPSQAAREPWPSKPAREPRPTDVRAVRLLRYEDEPPRRHGVVAILLTILIGTLIGYAAYLYTTPGAMPASLEKTTPAVSGRVASPADAPPAPAPPEPPP
jgi:ribosomal protein L40E